MLLPQQVDGLLGTGVLDPFSGPAVRRQRAAVDADYPLPEEHGR